MRGRAVDDHGAFEYDGLVEFEQVLPEPGVLDGGRREAGAHEGGVDPRSVSPFPAHSVLSRTHGVNAEATTETVFFSQEG